MWKMPKLDMYSFDTVNQIAVDWASNNWYFLDDTRELIQLCSFKTHDDDDEKTREKQNTNLFLCKTILSVHLSKPRGIALDPSEGLMFFTIWGSDPSSLSRASLDGEARTVLVDSKIVYPYGLTLDFPMKRIYWVDTYLDYIGKNKKLAIIIFFFETMGERLLFLKKVVLSQCEYNIYTILIYFALFFPLLQRPSIMMVETVRRSFEALQLKICIRPRFSKAISI